MPALRSARRIALAALVISLLAVPIAAAVVPHSGQWVGRVVKGQALSGTNGQPAFSVKGGRLTKFTIHGVGGFCFSGYTVVSVFVPAARIRSGRFSTTYHPVKQANVKLSGRFVSKTSVKGTVVGSGSACDYTIGFVAHPR